MPVYRSLACRHKTRGNIEGHFDAGEKKHEAKILQVARSSIFFARLLRKKEHSLDADGSHAEEEFILI